MTEQQQPTLTADVPSTPGTPTAPTGPTRGGSSTTAPAPACDICCERMNRSTRKPIVCQYCEGTVCLECAKTYVTSSTAEPNCMLCRAGWTHSFIRSTFPRSWLNKEYRAQRSQLLFEQELAKMPATQDLCAVFERKTEATERKAEVTARMKAIKAQLVTLDREHQTVLQDLWIYKDAGPEETPVKDKTAEQQAADRKDRSFRLERQKKEQEAEYEACQAEAAELQTRIDDCKRKIARRPETRTEERFRMRCPHPSCRGFVNSVVGAGTNGTGGSERQKKRCGLCKRDVCSRCGEIQQANHNCDPHDVQTMDILRKDSRPCVRCGTMITKNHGCDQMWCTECHTAFSWQTGELLRHFHNPHYLDWMRGKGRTIPRIDTPDCEQLINERGKYAIVKRIHEVVPVGHRDPITNMVGLVLDLQERLDLARASAEDATLMDRIAYMTNRIDEAEFRDKIYRRDKESSKRNHYREIDLMLIDVCDDLLHQLLSEQLPLHTVLGQMDALRLHVNAALKEIADQFACKSISLAEDYSSLN